MTGTDGIVMVVRKSKGLARATGRPLAPADAALAAHVAEQTLGERLHSALCFEALRRPV